MWNRVIEKWYSHGISNRHFARGVCWKCTIAKRSHRINPRLAGTINEAAINPTRHLVQLKDNVHDDANKIAFVRPALWGCWGSGRSSCRSPPGGKECICRLCTPCRRRRHIFRSLCDAFLSDIRSHWPSPLPKWPSGRRMPRELFDCSWSPDRPSLAWTIGSASGGWGGSDPPTCKRHRRRQRGRGGWGGTLKYKYFFQNVNNDRRINHARCLWQNLENINLIAIIPRIWQDIYSMNCR